MIDYNTILKDINTLNELDDFKKALNEAIEKRQKSLTIAENACEMSNRNFGYLKDYMENSSAKLYERASGKKLIKKYISCIKESESLSNMHNLYENIRKTDNGQDCTYLLGEIASTDWGCSTKKYRKSLEKLGNIVAEAYIMAGDSRDEYKPEKSMSDYYEAVEYIAENRKTNKNISTYNKYLNVINEHISSKHGLTENKALDTFFTNVFNGSEMISESKEDTFNRYKTECIDRLTEHKQAFIKAGDEENAKKINTLQEGLKKKTYNEENYINDLANLEEMLKELD